MFLKHLKSYEEFFNERERLREVIRQGEKARAELNALEHKYGWAIFSTKGVKTAFKEVETE